MPSIIAESKMISMKLRYSLKIFSIILLMASLFALSNCKKDDNHSPVNILSSKVWKRGLTDKNPATNPSGKIVYYAVKDCEKEETFKFDLNGTLTLNRHGEKCDPNESTQEILSYTLNQETKKLTIDGTDYILLEESENQIKYAAVLPSATGDEYLIFLLQ